MMDEATLFQVNPSDFEDLTPQEARTLNLLLEVWQRKIDGNIRNEAYYWGKVRPVTDDGSMPRELRNLSVAVGWGAKCVDVLAARSVLLGFDGDQAQEFSDVVGGKDVSETYSQAVHSELADSCAFFTVSHGQEGEPDAIITARSALDSAGVWNARLDRLEAGLAVLDIDYDESGLRVPTWVVLYTPETTVTARISGGKWATSRAENPLGRPLMEPIRYRPSLTRPFGRSRINRSIRSLIDRAMCVASRMETSATFYTWPLRYMLNVDKKTAEEASKRKIEMYTDSWVFASTNKEGESPQIGQLSQMTMQPHLDHFQLLAKQFASEASVPLDEVGVVFDNPSSADAIEAAQQRLVIEAENLNRANARALRNVAWMAMQAVDGRGPSDPVDVRPRFKDPLRVSRAAATDAAMKNASVVPEYAETPQYWLDQGYDPDEAEAIRAEIQKVRDRRAIAQAAVQAVAAETPSGQAAPTSSGSSEAGV